jgi:urease alpha subunit
LLRGGLVANTAVPPIEVSLEDGTVTLDGHSLRADPVERVPLSRRYLLG